MSPPPRPFVTLRLAGFCRDAFSLWPSQVSQAVLPRATLGKGLMAGSEWLGDAYATDLRESAKRHTAVVLHTLDAS